MRVTVRDIVVAHFACVPDDELAPGDIRIKSGVARGTVSEALARMLADGLVVASGVSKTRRYRAGPALLKILGRPAVTT